MTTIIFILVAANLFLMASCLMQKSRAKHLRENIANMRQRQADLKHKRSQMKSNATITVKQNNLIPWTWTKESGCFIYDSHETLSRGHDTQIITEDYFFNHYFDGVPGCRTMFQEFVDKRPEGHADTAHIMFPFGGAHSSLWADMNATALERDADGRATCIMGFVTFINQDSQLQTSELLQSIGSSTQISKMPFIADVNCEIEPVLNKFMSAKDRLRMADNSEEEQRLLTQMEQETAIIEGMLTNTITLSRIESDQWEFRKQETYLDELIYGIYGHLSDVFRNSLTDVELRIGDRGSMKHVMIDAQVARTALACIIDNAMKFTSKGSVTIGYNEGSDEHCPSIAFYVEDTGSGIAPEQLTVLFDRFVKLDSNSNGLGIGLYVCKLLVSKAGGHIDVTSEPNRGTRVTVELPVEPIDIFTNYRNQ